MESKTIIANLANLLQSCIDKKAHLLGKLLHGYILRSGLSADTFLLNRLVEFYSKCGHTRTARHVFDKIPNRNIYSWHAMLDGYCKGSNLKDAHELFAEMPDRNTVSWNTLISALVQTGFEQRALDVYGMMNLEGFVPTRFTLASVLSACGGLGDVGCGRECHGVAIKIGLDKNMYVGNALLYMYACKCRCIEDAIRAFGDLPGPNEVSFTAMIGMLAESYQVEEAFSMFRSMIRTGIRIDCVSLSSVLGVCASGGAGEFCDSSETYGFPSYMHGQQIHGLTVKLGFERDLHLINSLLDMYVKKGDMDNAEIIFSYLPEMSVVSWNIMIGGYGQRHQTDKAVEYMRRMQIQGYSQSENYKEAIRLFREMQFRGVQPDRTALAIVLSSCAGMGFLEGGKQVHAASVRAMFHTDVYVASGLIGMYSKCNKIEMAICSFDRLPEMDIVCWNSMIAGLSLNYLEKEAFTLFKQMLGKGMLSNQFSYTMILSCCAKLSSLYQGRQIHAHIEKDGYVNDVFVGSSLINMYSKCGDVDRARQYFDEMPCKNIVTWNEMIHGYAQHGCGDEAVTLYEDMIESGQEPDGITFVAVLMACSHSGLVDMGTRIFNSMQLEHGVEPLLDHYTCVVDALGRAGRFDEAEVLIDNMPYKDDPIIWEVLLSACRVHANVSLARRAAEELFCLDPHNSAPYVLVANIYSSLGRWEEAKVVRQMMSDKRVLKNPGYSWVEHKNRMQVFKVDDDFRIAVDAFEEANVEMSCFHG
ncbi:pentatricopeptide repeat (PPR) superfamily protein [Actinidia rufa]|uniref:Pentatricopeptide repeat (PPR) superfamily protein n=1 Tax=Actinidia rufa TaxID=165716 RepID=A0A7J0D7P0_9ERIC|nr:pentatricopeptide repeat (PPR) superfamily protein [Actinidia rufa]